VSKTVIFDMDGVLVDSEPFHCEAWIQAYKEIGITIDRDYYFTNICGNHGLVSSTKVLEEHGIDDDPERLNRRKEIIASSLIENKIKPATGVSELIATLKKEGYKVGLASSSSMITVSAILSTLNLKDAFAVIHAMESINKGKPNPDVYSKTAKMLDSDPQECIVIEDTRSGVIAAKRAGMKVIGILNGRNKETDLEYADIIVDSFTKITPEVLKTI